MKHSLDEELIPVWMTHPERVAHGHVQLPAVRLDALRVGPHGHGVHQSLPLFPLELLRHLHDVAAQVLFESKIKANLRAVHHILGSSA
jgi:hypothetical protein